MVLGGLDKTVVVAWQIILVAVVAVVDIETVVLGSLNTYVGLVVDGDMLAEELNNDVLLDLVVGFKKIQVIIQKILVN